MLDLSPNQKSLEYKLSKKFLFLKEWVSFLPYLAFLYIDKKVN